MLGIQAITSKIRKILAGIQRRIITVEGGAAGAEAGVEAGIQNFPPVVEDLTASSAAAITAVVAAADAAVGVADLPVF
ncbi:hypothetical protein CLOM_g7887 [Closterium sp. NIES-68]|nr:hypothetical protein CLOM_g7887 [Closterium sp. NIES-68]